MQMFGPIQLRFRYQATYLPKRCWYERDAYFNEDAFAKIRKTEPEEAPIVFKVRFPIQKTRAAFKFEIRRYDGVFWWPLTCRGTVVDPPLTEPEFLAGLAAGEDFLDVQGPKERFEEARPVKTIIRNNRDEVWASLQRELAENVMLCGGFVYIPGGQPVFILSRNLHVDGAVITVAGTGPDRALSLRTSGLRHAAGNYNSYEAQKAFQSGEFELADDRLAAQERGRSFRFDRDYVPMIETATSDLTLLSKDEIRLDAIFRRAMASHDESISLFLAKPFEAHRKCYSVLREVAAGDPHGNNVTADRLHALRTLASFAKTRSAYELSFNLPEMLRHFEELERSPNLREVAPLTDDEGEALRDFA